MQASHLAGFLELSNSNFPSSIPRLRQQESGIRSNECLLADSTLNARGQNEGFISLTEARLGDRYRCYWELYLHLACQALALCVDFTRPPKAIQNYPLDLKVECTLLPCKRGSASIHGMR